MKTGTFILGFLFLITSFFAIFSVFYFYFNIPEIQINPKVSAERQNHFQNFYDFDNLLKKFFKKKENIPQKVIKPKEPEFPVPELKAIYFGKRKLALLRFETPEKKLEDLWIREGEKKYGWKLKKVSPFFVVLSAKDREVKLELFKKGEKKRNPGFSKQSPVIKKEKGGIFVVSKETLSQLTSNIGRLFSQIGLRPYFYRGRIEGMQIVYLDPNSIFTKAGLRRGDIILTINNVPIKTTEDTYRIFESLETSPRIEVKIKRGNRIITLRAEVR
jgi:general secretion pathway protein C